MVESPQVLLQRLAALEERLGRLEAACHPPDLVCAGSKKSFGGKTKDLSESMLLLAADVNLQSPSRLVVLASFNYQAGSRVHLHLGQNVSSDAIKTDFEFRLARGDKSETFARSSIKDNLVAQRPITLSGATLVKETGHARVELRFSVSESHEPFDQFVRITGPQLFVWLVSENGK
ncbi:hypothetical protein HS125_12685 [bacterium]|nr:hypothetical protein [bacterium]